MDVLLNFLRARFHVRSQCLLLSLVGKFGLGSLPKFGRSANKQYELADRFLKEVQNDASKYRLVLHLWTRDLHPDGALLRGTAGAWGGETGSWLTVNPLPTRSTIRFRFRQQVEVDTSSHRERSVFTP